MSKNIPNINSARVQRMVIQSIAKKENTEVRKPVAFLYSGQGSQYYHMATSLMVNDTTFRNWMNELDDVAKALVGYSIVDCIYSNRRTKADRFECVLETHPAIFMVEYSLSRVLIDSGIKPDLLVSMSLGEFSASAVAGVLTPFKALEMVIEQAHLLESRCSPGRMLAIFCEPDLYHGNRDVFEGTFLVGINMDEHFVVAGTETKLFDVAAYLEKNKVLYQILPVSRAFHSPLVDEAKDSYLQYLYSCTYREPNIPLYSCTSSRRLDVMPVDHFWQVARQPIYFQETFIKIEAQAAHTYIDLGPGGTLANFARRNLRKVSRSDVYSVITPFDREIDNLVAMKQAINHQ